MRKHDARRLLLFVPPPLGASILIFVLMRLVPGDIAEILVYQTGTESSAVQQKQIQQIRDELGLNRPVVVQYLAWLGNALRGDFGYSYTQRRPVTDILKERFPRSMELAFLTIVVALIWPTLAQAYYISPPITRLTRSQMLEVIRHDYVRTARAKGLAERAVVYRHALGNSLLPVITFIGWWGGRLLGGIVIMEIIFAIPGMGTALVQAVSYRDYPTVQAIIFVMALVYLTINLFVDLMYGWLDPRIRYA